MAHHISAVLLRGAFDEEKAKVFGLKPISLTADLTLFPLNASQTDTWSENLCMPGWRAEVPCLNSLVIHHLIRSVASAPLFAIIETDYFSEHGTQAAAVYCGDDELMPPESGESGPINKALRFLGMRPANGIDEFDTVGLGRFRNFDDL